MSSLRIFNVEPDRYSSAAYAILASLGEVTNGPVTREELLGCISDFDVLIIRLAHQIDREVLEGAVRLKAIVTATTGLDHIDEEYAQSRGIAVLSLRGEYKFLRSIPATAEHTWALLLALLRRIPAAFQSVLAGEWERDRFRGHDLAGKTLGILGLGRIGEKVAHYGEAFGMRVMAYDPYRTGWPVGVEKVMGKTALFSGSQVLSVHIPLNNETKNSIGAEEFSLLPPGAVLVNTSRGQIIVEEALLAALEDGRLAGAALDVICDERGGVSIDSPLIQYARTNTNLLVTPHIGGATHESMAATEIFMARKLKRIFHPYAKGSCR